MYFIHLKTQNNILQIEIFFIYTYISNRISQEKCYFLKTIFSGFECEVVQKEQKSVKCE